MRLVSFNALEAFFDVFEGMNFEWCDEHIISCVDFWPITHSVVAQACFTRLSCSLFWSCFSFQNKRFIQSFTVCP